MVSQPELGQVAIETSLSPTSLQSPFYPLNSFYVSHILELFLKDHSYSLRLLWCVSNFESSSNTAKGTLLPNSA